MNRYLLLILLSSWAHVVPLSSQCDTGDAHANHLLSIPRSLMANADVAVLKNYHAESLDKCITECCSEQFGSCTVASFRKNTTEENCQHFNCRPVEKCVFLSSSSTDSFSFSSSSSPQILVPSSHASKNESLSSPKFIVATNKSRINSLAQNKEKYGVTKETVATYTEEQFALINDNTTIKPRKGVEVMIDGSAENVSNRSGVKARKGVSLDGVSFLNNIKSKVKPRKGVGPYQSQSISSSTVFAEPPVHPTVSAVTTVSTTLSSNGNYKNIVADDVVSALEKIFEDDSNVKDVKPPVVSSSETSVQSTQTSAIIVHSTEPSVPNTTYAFTSDEKTTSTVLQSSFSTSLVVSSSVGTPDLSSATAYLPSTDVSRQTPMLSTSSPSIVEHSKLLFHETSNADAKSEESENERKYESSMHLVLSLVFGLLVLFFVIGAVIKRMYDSWQRRYYRRVDFLIDGMYNGDDGVYRGEE